jgi:hypothetical protein
MKLKVQLPHPGSQKPFKLHEGYGEHQGKIFRKQNQDHRHYRKFIKNGGTYLDDNSDVNPKKANLFFWGEWEGRSYFEPIGNFGNQMPNGVHQPVYVENESDGQNTDPFIFGSDFKYSYCKQRGELCSLEKGSLILFGSTYRKQNKFYIDTVFVIKDGKKAIDVHSEEMIGYSPMYIQQTLKRIPEYSSGVGRRKSITLYDSQTWWDNKDYFSFVPCKLNHDGTGFERLAIYLNEPKFDLSSNSTGVSYLRDCYLKPIELWQEIVKKAIEQGFQLGIQFEEPPTDSTFNSENKGPNLVSSRAC